jgi:hypothetical protein
MVLVVDAAIISDAMKARNARFSILIMTNKVSHSQSVNEVLFSQLRIVNVAVVSFRIVWKLSCSDLMLLVNGVMACNLAIASASASSCW